jgi:hypothetical protein
MGCLKTGLFRRMRPTCMPMFHVTVDGGDFTMRQIVARVAYCFSRAGDRPGGSGLKR